GQMCFQTGSHDYVLQSLALNKIYQ
ncbi:MAG: hypothetical protein RI907_335, partial [Pseudomonadota bacterium]